MTKTTYNAVARVLCILLFVVTFNPLIVTCSTKKRKIDSTLSPEEAKDNKLMDSHIRKALDLQTDNEYAETILIKSNVLIVEHSSINNQFGLFLDGDRMVPDDHNPAVVLRCRRSCSSKLTVRNIEDSHNMTAVKAKLKKNYDNLHLIPEKFNSYNVKEYTLAMSVDEAIKQVLNVKSYHANIADLLSVITALSHTSQRLILAVPRLKQFADHLVNFCRALGIKMPQNISEWLNNTSELLSNATQDLVVEPLVISNADIMLMMATIYEPVDSLFNKLSHMIATGSSISQPDNHNAFCNVTEPLVGKLIYSRLSNNYMQQSEVVIASYYLRQIELGEYSHYSMHTTDIVSRDIESFKCVATPKDEIFERNSFSNVCIDVTKVVKKLVNTTVQEKDGKAIMKVVLPRQLDYATYLLSYDMFNDILAILPMIDRRVSAYRMGLLL